MNHAQLTAKTPDTLLTNPYASNADVPSLLNDCMLNEFRFFNKPNDRGVAWVTEDVATDCESPIDKFCTVILSESLVLSSSSLIEKSGKPNRQKDLIVGVVIATDFAVDFDGHLLTIQDLLHENPLMIPGSDKNINRINSRDVLDLIIVSPDSAIGCCRSVMTNEGFT